MAYSEENGQVEEKASPTPISIESGMDLGEVYSGAPSLVEGQATREEMHERLAKLSPAPREEAANYSTNLAPIYIAEQIFFYVLLKGGKGNPFSAINSKWFSELAAVKIRELLTPAPRIAEAYAKYCAESKLSGLSGVEGLVTALTAEKEKAEIIEVNLADYAKRYFDAFDMYSGAWLREMGGVIRHKHHQIDGFVLRARDIYEKAQLVDRMKQIMVKRLKEKCSAEEMFDAVFKMLAENGRDKIPTN